LRVKRVEAQEKIATLARVKDDASLKLTPNAERKEALRQLRHFRGGWQLRIGDN
jgi:hypothetical protein